jgi:hypothetical protein
MLGVKYDSYQHGLNLDVFNLRMIPDKHEIEYYVYLFIFLGHLFTR